MTLLFASQPGEFFNELEKFLTSRFAGLPGSVASFAHFDCYQKQNPMPAFAARFFVWQSYGWMLGDEVRDVKRAEHKSCDPSLARKSCDGSLVCHRIDPCLIENSEGTLLSMLT